MRIYKFIFIGIIITLVSIGYVHQHVEIVKAGYQLQENRSYHAYLVDQNSKLMYNLSKLESPKNLLASLSGEEIRFAGHRTRRIAAYQLASYDSASRDTGEGLIGRFFDLFTPDAEARPHLETNLPR